MAKPETLKPLEDSKRGKILYIIAAAVHAVATGIILYNWSEYIATVKGFGLVALWTLYTLLSVKMAEKGHGIAIWSFNAPGFVWPRWINIAYAPFGITSVTYPPKMVLEREFPDDPEYVFKETDDKPLPDPKLDPETGKYRAYSRPIRITTGGALKAEKYAGMRQKNADRERDAGPGEHLNHQMTVEQNIAVRYHICDPFTFHVRMKGRTMEEKLAYAEREMADTIVPVLRNEYNKRPIGIVLLELQDIEGIAAQTLEERVKEWGIEIDQLVVKPPDLTLKVNTALASVPEEEAKADAAAIRGTGKGLEVGNEQREVAKGQADAAASLKMSPETVVLLGVVDKVIKPADKIILGTAGVLEGLGIPDAVRKALSGQTNTGGKP